jgi:hypothetical protein
VRADIKRKCTWLKRLKNGGAVIAGFSAIVSIGSNLVLPDVRHDLAVISQNVTKTQVVDFSALDNTTIQTLYSGAAALLASSFTSYLVTFSIKRVVIFRIHL